MRVCRAGRQSSGKIADGVTCRNFSQFSNMTKLALEEGPGWARVSYPVIPRWLCITQILTIAMVGVAHVAAGVMVIVMTWRLLHGLGGAGLVGRTIMEHAMMSAALSFGLGAVAWLSLAADQLWQFRRWGRVPRTLLVTDKGIVRSYLGWRRMREKLWPASQITSVELRPVKWNLTPKKTLVSLYIYRHNGRRLRFQDEIARSAFAETDRTAVRITPRLPAEAFVARVFNPCL